MAGGLADIPRARRDPPPLDPERPLPAVPGGLRNVVGTIPGRNPRRKVVLGAHYDTKDLPGFVGANDAASGTAVVRELARTIKPRRLQPTLIIVFFDGEEAPPGKDAIRAVRARGGRRAGRSADRDRPRLRRRQMAIPRDQFSNRRLWRLAGGVAAHRLRAPLPGPRARARPRRPRAVHPCGRRRST